MNPTYAVDIYTEQALKRTHTRIKTAKPGSEFHAKGKGDIDHLKDVLEVDDHDISDTIFSVPRLDVQGYKVVFENRMCKVFDESNNLIT